MNKRGAESDGFDASLKTESQRMGSTRQIERPATLECRIDNLLAELREYLQWVIWKHTWDTKAEKWDKPPVDPNTGSAASSNGN